MQYSVIKDSDDTTIILEDGGIATIHNNGEHLITTYFQSRVDKFTFDDDMWSKLDDGKQYIRDWAGQTKVTDALILDALRWMAIGVNEFTEVNSHHLISNFNNH